MEKIALLFAGQGSQTTGMGKDFYDESEEIRNLYLNASSILGYDLTVICFNENDLIHQTQYTQPAILITSIAILQMMKKVHPLHIQAMAGFSLGEYSALYASGVFDFQTIIKLIQKRATYMHEASTLNQGGMAAVLGLDQTTLQALCDEVTNVWIANYNCPNQLVVSGLTSSLETLSKLAKDAGARRVVPLQVSGGFHSPLMKEAAQKLFMDILDTTYHKPNVDLYLNCSGKKLEQIDQLPEFMKQQVESSVYFEDTIRNMINEGITTFIEIGPGSVLSGFVKKIDGSKKIITLNKLSDFKQLEDL